MEKGKYWRKQKMEKGKAAKKGSVWKKVAIGGIIVFSIIILLVAVKISRFKSEFGSFSKVSEEQNEKVLSLLEDTSSEEGYVLKDYDIRIGDKVRGINIENQKRHVLGVSLESENEAIFYLIDADDWIIVQSSKTKYSGWMLDSFKRFSQHKPLPPPEMGRWFHNELMMEKDRRTR